MPRFWKLFLPSPSPTKDIVFMHWRSFSDFKLIKVVRSYSGVSLARGVWYVTVKCPTCYWFTCLFCAFSSCANNCIVAGFGPASGDMPRQTAEQTIQAQSRNQQRAEASSRGGEPFQVSILLYRDLVALDI